MSVPGNSLDLALLSAAMLGFRHGFDYDHIAAISDISSVQTNPGRSMRLGLIYALGHAATVAVLGSLVIFFQLSLPRGIDSIAERLVGLTLVLLGIYVLGSMFNGNYAPRSRAALIVNSARWFHWKLRGHWHPHLPKPKSSNWSYDAKSVFGIGVIHGLGAETPSQLFIFLLAANLGGVGKGFLGLAMFVAGLLVMNTIMTACAAKLFGASIHLPKFQFAITAVTAAYSLVVGTIFLFGSSGLLPTLG
jgi:ABC-type nickel/cobalt efflux system permease component RcnA